MPPRLLEAVWKQFEAGPFGDGATSRIEAQQAQEEIRVKIRSHTAL